MNEQNDIPVYLFTGFLESGKTKFIQETLEDKRFNNGERTLLLVCEEGEEEYAPDQDLALKRDDATLSFETDTSDWLALSSLQDGLVRVTTRGASLSGQLTLCTEKDAHVMVVR